MPLTIELLKQCPNRWFVETGTHHGDGVQTALDAGFQKVATIEAHPGYWQKAKARFAGRPEVLCWLGDSARILPEVIRNIAEPATFWLDAHCAGVDTAGGPNPVPHELDAIAAHPIKTHTILIDDIRLWGAPIFFEGLTVEGVSARLRQINPAYEIIRVDGCVPGDILVARIKA